MNVFWKLKVNVNFATQIECITFLHNFGCITEFDSILIVIFMS